jgi:protocatechuate 3,4-dioxygenase beta subunit
MLRWLWLLGMAVAVLAGAAVQANTIESTAQAQWIENGVQRQIDSNNVVVIVERAEIRLSLFRVATGSAPSITFTPSRCLASDGAGNPPQQQTVSIEPSTQFRAGETILFEVIVPQANRDRAEIDNIRLIVSDSRGGRSELIVFETGPDTGRFFGGIRTSRTDGGTGSADCLLVIPASETAIITIPGTLPGSALLNRDVPILADPFGKVFDSETGAPVSAVRVTLRDADSGEPAQVFAEDGNTPWPSSVVSGEPITDEAGNVYPMLPGQYWFPVVSPGRYRLDIEPPPPFNAPSIRSPQQLARLTRSDGRALVISDASYGASFDVNASAPAEIDIPVDLPSDPILLDMTVSRAVAQPGDVLLYSLTAKNSQRTRARRDVKINVEVPRWLRLRPESIRIDGARAPDAVQISPDGMTFEITLETIPAEAGTRIVYGAAVRANAPPGQLASTAEAIDALGDRSVANALVRVERDNVAGRMTIIGRVALGACDDQASATGLGGIRVMMEDGSFAITDADGRYRFEGVVPGTHVVQVAVGTLPPGSRLVECSGSTRSAGSATSRFVIGQGGSLARVDFHAVALVARPASRIEPALDLALDNGVTMGEPPTTRLPTTSPPATSLPAPPATAWLAMGDGPDGWISPTEDHNPRVPAIKVAFRHRAGQTIRLYVNGEPINPVAFDGSITAADGKFAVSLWRGVPLVNERTVLSAEIINSLGGVNARFEREVFFTSQPARAEVVTDTSVLVADGVTRPVVAVRITDRNGRPVREGLSGNFTLNAPFESAVQIEQQQIRQLSGIGAASARWVVEGDEGIARIELAPTMISGQLRIAFDFSNDNIRRRQEIEAWIVPGDIEWTLVGLGEATLGARSVADNMERAGNFDSDMGSDARIALYAKGRVLGKYLLTLAYDSAKQREDQPLLGAIDPTAYYTVFADNSQRRFDAATREKLYVRIESSTFFALYGDFQTGFDQTRLGRYQRTATGIRAEKRVGNIRAEAFGASIGSIFQRDEFQGNGLAGPYPLTIRDIVINSERVTVEVRDRFRSEVIISSRSLTRFIDYNIDVLSGTITFSEPILSRDFDLNPQIVIIEYETNQNANGAFNGGFRADWTSEDSRFRVGTTAITDNDDGLRTNIGVADARLQIGKSTELRSEIALSHSEEADAGAWLIEMQHQTGKLDIIAYAQSIDGEYGTGQQSVAEAGRRKLGLDVRYQLSENLTATTSALQDESLGDATQRRGGQARLTWRSPATDALLGLAHFNDSLANGDRNTSTVLETGLTRRLLGNRLELSAASSMALGAAESVDLPSRHQFGLRFALMRDIRLTGTYEIAEGAELDARSLRAGVEVTPWQGARLSTNLAQNTTGNGPGHPSLGFGAQQTINVSPAISLSATVDGNRIMGTAPAAENVINPAQPVANGGPVGVDQPLFDDFTAATLSGTWRSGRWTANGRGEYRDGEMADRQGLALSVIRQIGEGSSIGGNVIWTRSTSAAGGSSEITDAILSIAHRPDTSDFALLGRLEYRSDTVTGAVSGTLGPEGRTAITANGDAVSRRLIGSVSGNLSPRRRGGAGKLSEVGLFLGTRYSFDRLEGIDLSGLTALAGLDLRLGLNEWVDIGGSASLRANATDGVFNYAVGPQVSVVVAEGALLSFGYNIVGFRDPDFSRDRALDNGIFAAIRFKFDAGLFGASPSPTDATAPPAPAFARSAIR